MQSLNPYFIYFERIAIQTYLAQCGKSNCPALLNHQLTVIDLTSWKAKFNFISHTQAWLLPDLLNHEITQTEASPTKWSRLKVLKKQHIMQQSK